MGEVLIPLQEQERRAIAEAAQDFVIGLLAVNPEMPVRYDPPVHKPRKLPEPKSFYSGRPSRTLYRVKRYNNFSKT